MKSTAVDLRLRKTEAKTVAIHTLLYFSSENIGALLSIQQNIGVKSFMFLLFLIIFTKHVTFIRLN